MSNFQPFRVLLAFVFLFTLGACASLPTDYTKEPSTAIPASDETTLGSNAGSLAADHPGQSGFYLLPYGVDALGARLLLADRAEVSIDVQYYMMLQDTAGYLLFGRLVMAADRGVRVRVLLDDISTKGYEQFFAVLSAHSNIEIRLTNPFADRRTPALGAVDDFKRVNHRMHNKSITFDNAVTVFGGRNIGAEYFGASDKFNYHDLDVLGIGPVAQDVSEEFDLYWNATESIPVTAFVDPDGSTEAAQQLSDRFLASIEEARNTPYGPALQHTLADSLLTAGNDSLTWAASSVVFDLPYGEVSEEGVQGPEVLRGILVEAIDKAESEVLMVSPYFVPSDSGVERFRRLRERGVRCVVVTNSLASTDVHAVYSGYRDYHRPLLEIGVELWEVMAYPSSPNEQAGASTERRGLHAKTFAVDRQRLFVGSFNWDPRSMGINTEMGALIESEELASQMVTSVLDALPGSAWQVRLGDDGELEWVEHNDGKVVTYDVEPQTDLKLRMSADILDIGGIEDQL